MSEYRESNNLVKYQVPTGKIPAPRALLSLINQSYLKSITLQLSEIQDLLQAQVEHFVLGHVSEDYPISQAYKDCSEISFHMELIGNSFQLIPHNLYTVILNNGEFIQYKIIEGISRFSTEKFTYIFDPLEQKAHIIHNTLTISTKDGVIYEAIPEK